MFGTVLIGLKFSKSIQRQQLPFADVFSAFAVFPLLVVFAGESVTKIILLTKTLCLGCISM